jgi:hypothetical protein
MGFLDRFRAKGETTAGTEQQTQYKVGMKVPCMSCNRKIRIQTLGDNKGKIVVATVDNMLPLAFRCRNCDYITCVECALLAYELHNPREGLPTCPSCGRVGGQGPILFAEWLDLKG